MYEWLVWTKVGRDNIIRKIYLKHSILYEGSKRDIINKLSNVYDLQEDDINFAINTAVNTTINYHYSESELKRYFDRDSLAFKIPKTINSIKKKYLLREALKFFEYFVQYLENTLMYLKEERNLDSWIICEFRFDSEAGHFEPVQ